MSAAAKRAPRAPARDPSRTGAPAPRVVSVELPETDRRTPLAVARVAAGPFTFAVGVVLTRSGWLEARPPLSALGKPAVETQPPGLWAEVEAAAIAAVKGDAAAQRHLEGHRARRFRANAGFQEHVPVFQMRRTTP